jgi:CheY-like chemotaxis protein
MTKILLVEDDKSLREIYGVRLLAEGYDIVSAGDGEEALAMAIKEKPQLIVSDVMMPKISGFDMLDILRSTTETKAIKVIMMTALSSEDQRARGQALGADRYLVKSQVGIEDVVRTVHDVLGDAPTSMPSPAQTFGPQASSAAPTRTAQPAIPQRPTPSAPAMPQPTPAQPSVPQPATPQPTNLPQPTAPFSTTRPANLGDRIIHPLTPPAGSAPQQDLGKLIDQELNAAPVAAPTAPEPPVAMPVAPTPQPSPSVTPPEPPQPPVTTTIPVSTPQPQPQPTPAPAEQDSGISFEETPRPQPPTYPGNQPPVA